MKTFWLPAVLHRLGASAGLIIALFVGATGALPAIAQGTETIDTLITGSINQAAPPAPGEKGSAAFRQALELISADRYAEAYEAARALEDSSERRAIQWAAIYLGKGEIDYRSVRRFADDAPEFSARGLFQTRVEQALTLQKPGNAAVIEALAGSPPISIEGQIALAAAYQGEGKSELAAALVRPLWVEQYLDPKTESQVREKFGSLLRRDDHWARAVHLMMNDRASGVERLLPFLSAGQKSLAIARIAVSRKDGDAKKKLDAVDAAFQSHPVFIYSRAQRARQAGLFESAVDWLNKAKGDLPDAEEWWYERRALIRQILGTGDVRLAYNAADTYRTGPEGRLVEARFHAGWIALSFLGDAAAAKPHFETMAGLSTLPDSVTQAQYWLGRTYLKLGDEAKARAAFGVAADYGTVYYGLLARAELGLNGIEIRGLPDYRGAEAAFESESVIRAVRLLSANGKDSLALPLLRNFALGLKDGPQLVLAARLAQAINAHHLAISIADTAEKRGAPLDLFNFPKDGLPVQHTASVDTAAVYAIARQESKFQIDAVSSVGARGLMQLMPATAKETAAKVGVAYSENRLTSDPGYNTLLGSTYLSNQLARFDGSLVLAAAAYNAGGGNANKWIAAYGDPRAANVDPVVWVELIPFQETRKYVQRVLGNYLVYRARLGKDDMTMKDALRRIPG